MSSPTMAYDLTMRVHVACHRTESPRADEWTGYLSHISQHLERIDAILAFAPGSPLDGTSLTIAQQREASAFWSRAPKRPPIAVVTTSRTVVRAAGALKWFMPEQIRTFGVWDADGAWAHLRCDARTQRVALAKLTQLASGLGQPLTPEWTVSVLG